MLYIHQYPDWTKFRYNYQNVSDALGRARFLEGKLIGISDIVCGPEAETSILARDFFANFAVDGNVADQETIEAEILKRNNATDAVKNMMGALQNAKAPLTMDRLFAWHAAIGQNKVKNFRAKDSGWGVSPERIRHEMDRFLNWFETSSQDGALKAAIAQFWFLTIRPFDDGNGCIARTLSGMLLARSEESARCQYALNEYILLHKDDYFRILAKAQAGTGDLTEWILWFLQALCSSIETSLQRISPALKQMQFRLKFQGIDFTPRERKIFEAVFSGTLPQSFTVKEAATFCGVSHDSALRDIQSLIAKGVFSAESKGGRSQKYRII